MVVVVVVVGGGAAAVAVAVDIGVLVAVAVAVSVVVVAVIERTMLLCFFQAPPVSTSRVVAHFRVVYLSFLNNKTMFRSLLPGK